MNEEIEQLKQTVATLRADVNMANSALIAIAAALEKGPLQSLHAFDLLAEVEIADTLAAPLADEWPQLLSSARDRMEGRFHTAIEIYEARVEPSTDKDRPPVGHTPTDEQSTTGSQ